MIYGIAVLSASISFVTVLGECDQCNPPNVNRVTIDSNSMGFDGALSFAICYSACIGDGV